MMTILNENVVFGVGKRFNLWQMIPEELRDSVVVLVSERMAGSGELDKFIPLDKVQLITVVSSEPSIAMVEGVRNKIGDKKVSEAVFSAMIFDK